MARILILGASFAGLAAARELERLLPAHAAQTTLLDQSSHFVFRPSLPWLVFGQRRPEDISVPLRPLLEKWGVEFVQARAERLDLAAQEVTTGKARYRYDFLLLALGATSPPQRPPALAGYGHHPLWTADAMALKAAVDTFGGGGAVVALCPTAPLHCPAYEFVFHLDRSLRARGLRHRTAITMVTYEDAPFAGAGPAASALLGRWLQQRGIGFRPSTFIQRAGPGYVTLPSGETLPAALFIYIPPYAGPPVVRTAPGLTDKDGFVLVDRWLRSHRYGNVFAAGDITAFPGPKNGRMAEIQGRVAARNIAAALGFGTPAPYTSHMACLLDLGGNRGLAAVRKPAPQQGKVRTLLVWPGWLPHAGKIALEQYYLRFKLRA